MRRALVVRGGWAGHEPVAGTDSFVPELRRHGFQVEISEDLAVYGDPARLRDLDLIVQCWSMGELTHARARNLAAAVQQGTGFAGWHGGVVAAFDADPYLQLTGGRFVYHPPGPVSHELTVVPGRQHHPIMAGLSRVRVHTEKYWVLTDSLCDVLATVSFPPDRSEDAPEQLEDAPEPPEPPEPLPGGGSGGVGDPVTPWRREVTVPAVWTRQWGAGRVFVSTVGHRLADLEVPDVRALTGRGLLWAARG